MHQKNPTRILPVAKGKHGIAEYLLLNESTAGRSSATRFARPVALRVVDPAL
jgi:hypothetical protein